ncbi:MAG TPA: LysR substrate-binding domain-containing protein [Polyangiaceae bacterium]
MFCAVVEAGNYTQAAIELGLTKAAVSKAVARHEAVLGTRLFRRTTRSMQLSDAGRVYFERCRQALGLLADAERSLSQYQKEPEGLVRISVPTTYGHYRVLPLVEEFTTRYPRIALEVDVSNENVDLVAGRVDLAVRMGEIDDSSLIVQKLEDAPIGVFASPAYLNRHGTPRDLSELDRHTCIGFLRPSTGRALPWGFVDSEGKPFQLAPSKMLRCSGDFLGCVTLARNSAGLVQSYYYVVEDDVREGRLVEVLRPFAGRSRPFSLLRPPGQSQSLAVRTFADMLVERCAGRRTW